MNANEAKEKIVDLLDELSRDMPTEIYAELLDELGAEIEAREQCLRDEETANPRFTSDGAAESRPEASAAVALSLPAGGSYDEVFDQHRKWSRSWRPKRQIQVTYPQGRPLIFEPQWPRPW